MCFKACDHMVDASEAGDSICAARLLTADVRLQPVRSMHREPGTQPFCPPLTMRVLLLDGY
jgi:hypothetical protein